MKTNKLFKTSKGQNEIFNLYEEKLNRLNLDIREVFVKTTYGDTRLIISGSEKRPPLILVHGTKGNAVVALESYSKLRQSFQVYAVDLIAQPNEIAGPRLSMKDLSYGMWMHEVIGLLGLKEVSLAGFSFGGLVV